MFLFVAVRRGDKPADDHPFGYGKESYVWAFIAALFAFDRRHLRAVPVVTAVPAC